MEAVFYVYEHWRLDRDECFYVGEGKGNRAYSRKSRNPHWKAVVAKLERIGSAYEVRLVQTGLTQEEAFALEIERIAFWNDKVDLTNMLPGGQNGGGGMSGRKHKPETIERMKAAQKGKIISEETKEKLRLANLGKKASGETRAKMSAIRKGKPTAKRGQKASKESRAKMSEKRKGSGNSRATINEATAMAIYLSVGKHADVAKEFGVSRDIVVAIKHKRSWKHIHRDTVNQGS